MSAMLIEIVHEFNWKQRNQTCDNSKISN